MSYSLNSLNGGLCRDYVGAYYSEPQGLVPGSPKRV